MDADRFVAFADPGEMLAGIAFAPGQSLAALLTQHLPGIASLIGLDDGADTAFTIWTSIVAWLVALVVAGTIVNAIRDFDRRASAWIGGRYAELLRLGRVLRRRIVTTLHRRNTPTPECAVETVDLARAEMSILRCLARLDDDAVMTFDDIATRLGLSPRAARSVIARLADLELIERAADRMTRIEGLRISQAGQMYLLGA